MSVAQAVFGRVLDGWHKHSACDRVTPIREADGIAVLPPDLTGAAINAMARMSRGRRPFDPAAFAAAPAPIAGVTQRERIQAVVALVKARVARDA